MSYEDLYDHPHHVSKKHPRMSMENRAAQFSPFAALTGHSAAIEETARLTAQESVLDEYRLSDLNEQLALLQRQIREHPAVRIRYFLPDEKKAGGSYQTILGNVQKIDQFRKLLIMQDNTIVEMKHIADIQIIKGELHAGN